MNCLENLGKSNHSVSNWAKTHTCTPKLFFEPVTINDVKEILSLARNNGLHVRVVGNGHSPSDIFCTNDYLVSMKKFSKVLQILPDKHQIKVESGILVTDLNEHLKNHNLAMPILGSVSDITIAGAISTATHGSGNHCHIMSGYVLEFELILATGEVLTLSRERDEEKFLAASVSLGSLGIIYSVLLQCTPAFNLQVTQFPTKLENVLENIDVHVSSSEYFRLFWYPHNEYVAVEHCSKTAQPKNKKSSWFWDHFVGYVLLQFLLYLTFYVPSLNAYINKAYFFLYKRKSMSYVDVSHDVFNFDCKFSQFVMEWSIPRSRTAVVMLELKACIEANDFPAHFPIEIRFVASDDIYLSPSYGHDSSFINIVTYRPYNRTIEKDRYFMAFEKIMRENEGRPHWAKDHGATFADLRVIYPKWEKFHEIRRQLDPKGMFMNEHLKRIFEA